MSEPDELELPAKDNSEALNKALDRGFVVVDEYECETCRGYGTWEEHSDVECSICKGVGRLYYLEKLPY